MMKNQVQDLDPLEEEVPPPAQPACQRRLKVRGRTRRIVRIRSKPTRRKARRTARAKVAVQEAAKAKVRARGSPKAKPLVRFVLFRQVKVGPPASRRRRKVRDEPSSPASFS